MNSNIEMAKHLLMYLDENSNYGINSLHHKVLTKENADNLSAKVKTPLPKKQQTNFGMTQKQVACINTDVSFIRKLAELGANLNILDDLNRKQYIILLVVKKVGLLII